MENLVDILNRSSEAATIVNMTNRHVKFLFNELGRKFESLENAGSDVEINDIVEDIDVYLNELREVAFELVEAKKDPMALDLVQFLFERIDCKYEAFDSAENHKELKSIVEDMKVFLDKLKEVTQKLI
jgi:hypothetical protein